MTRFSDIVLRCSAALTVCAIPVASLAGESSSTSRIGLVDGLPVALAPAASTEEFHAPEATSVLPLLNDYEVFAVRLLLIKGHLQAGVEAYASGSVTNALAHLGEPVHVLHKDIVKWIDRPGGEPIETPLAALVAAVRASKSLDVVNRELATALHELDGALEILDAEIRESPAFVMLVAIAVLRTAADEYDIGVLDGSVVDVIEYQDARAFVLEAHAFSGAAADHLKARNAGAYGILMAEFAALEMELSPAEKFERTLTTAQDLRRAVVRIGLLYDSFK